jgi:Tfp pilus tip-associated adhesin PilY1
MLGTKAPNLLTPAPLFALNCCSNYNTPQKWYGLVDAQYTVKTIKAGTNKQLLTHTSLFKSCLKVKLV